MNSAYLFIGAVVFWAFILLIIAAIIYTIILPLFKRYIWNNDWFAYYIRRVTLPTDQLRLVYKHVKQKQNYAKRETLKYRLRNIRKAGKRCSR